MAAAGLLGPDLVYLFTGENLVLRASYRRVSKNTRMFTALLPFFGTDYGIWDERERAGLSPVT